MTFLLTDEPWIKVLWDEPETEVSLRTVFQRSGEIKEITGEVPTQAFAILRLLLAICHDAIGFHTDDDMDELYDNGLDLARIDAYLVEWAERFDLFHPERPFMQVADLRTAKDEWSGLEKIIADVPNGHPFFTTRAGDGIASLSPAEAARWLVHCHAFDPSGIRSAAVGDALAKSGKGYPIGPAWAGELGGVVLHGANLLETLCLNICKTPKNPADRPVWAKEVAHTAFREEVAIPKGPVELLTWQPRRVRLQREAGAVIGVVLAQGDRVMPQDMQAVEAMSGWRYSVPQSKKAGKRVYMPNKHDPARSLWRGLPALLAPASATVTDAYGTHEAFLPPQSLRELPAEIDTFTLQAIGISYGPQNATIEEIVNDRLELRASLLTAEAAPVRRLLHDAIANATNVVRAVGNLAANLSRAAGEKGDGAGDGARQRALTMAWAALDQPGRRWVGQLNAEVEVEPQHVEWQTLLRDATLPLADALAREAGPAAMRGRKTNVGFMATPIAQNHFHRDLRAALPLLYRAQKESRNHA